MLPPPSTMAAAAAPLHPRHVPSLLLLLLLLLGNGVALTQDGVLLLAFKSSLLADPLASLAGWAYSDSTPCAWNGVVCTAEERVVSVVLPDAQLVGPIARELGLVEHLRHVDLSGNALNGTIPVELLRAPELRVLSLAENGITGGLPELVGQLRSLRALNLAGNALSGVIPGNLAMLQNLTAVSLASNYFSGELPGGGFPALQVLDVSSNLLNGTLPTDFGGAALRYVNLSSNRIGGAIPPEMAARLPANVTIDLSYNNLTGAIPGVAPFAAQRATAFLGNGELCGKPLDSLCSDASTGDGENGRAKSPPAIAAIPDNPTDAPPGGAVPTAPSSGGQRRMSLATILAIATGDAGIAIVLVVIFYVYQARKRRRRQEPAKQRMGTVFKTPEQNESPVMSLSSCCPRKKAGDDMEEVTDTSASVTKKMQGTAEEEAVGKRSKDGGVLVMMDAGDVELELETLLKASAYILGTSGSSIVYKAVLAGGAVLAVRRIGSEDAGVKRFSEFDAQMRAISKLRHGNILRLRGFYWGPDELLIFHDLAVNGSLADVSSSSSAAKRKPSAGSLPIHLRWNARLRIARGVARGLAYLHDKKCVHGDVRPSNILLDADMAPLLADVGIQRLLHGSGRSGSKRSAKSLPEDLSPPPGASPCAATAMAAASYQAPEAVKNPRPSAKWDVYSYGVVLLELVAGRAPTSVEIHQWGAGEEEKVLRLADAALLEEMEGGEEAVVRCLRLGLACCAMAASKRPAMKEVVQTIDGIPSSSSS